MKKLGFCLIGVAAASLGVVCEIARRIVNRPIDFSEWERPIDPLLAKEHW